MVKHLQNDGIVATALQKLCLFRLFPIIFHDVIEDLPAMIVYKQLREMVDLVLSVPFRREWLPVLRDLSIAFHRSILIHFPDQIVPKIHYVCEYTQMTQDYGPPRRQWCVRYEAVHASFKKIVLRSNNFKNIPKMLATRFSLKQASRLSRLSLLENMQTAVGIRRIRIHSITDKIKQLVSNQFNNLNLNQDLVECRTLFHETIEYSRSSIYIIEIAAGSDQMKFGQINCIFKIEGQWRLVIELLETVEYNEYLCAWELKATDDFAVFDPCHLVYHHKGLDIYQLNDSSYVSFMARLTFHDVRS